MIGFHWLKGSTSNNADYSKIDDLITHLSNAFHWNINRAREEGSSISFVYKNGQCIYAFTEDQYNRNPDKVCEIVENNIRGVYGSV